MIASFLNRTSRINAILVSGLIVGIADAIAAMASAYLSKGVSPHRVWQYVASGAIGPRAFVEGTSAVVVGLAFHFLIATSFTALFFVAASRSKQLLKHLFVTGALYGMFVWLAMQYIVIPQSQIIQGKFNLSQAAIGWSIHIFVIGIPIVWMAKQHLRKH